MRAGLRRTSKGSTMLVRWGDRPQTCQRGGVGVGVDAGFWPTETGVGGEGVQAHAFSIGEGTVMEEERSGAVRRGEDGG